MTSHASILLVKLRHHGDVLLTTPVARALKTVFPNCQVDLLVYEGMEALVKNNPDLRHVWSWNRSIRGWRGMWSHVQLFKSLRAQHYDVVLHLSEQMQGALLARLLAPQQAIGIDYPKRRNFFWRSCFTDLIPLFLSNTRHTVEQHLAALEPLGIKAVGDQRRCRLVVEEKDRAAMQHRLEQASITKPYILIHPTARWFFKCWEDDRFATVIRLLSKLSSADEGSGDEGAQQLSVHEVLEGASTGTTTQSRKLESLGPDCHSQPEGGDEPKRGSQFAAEVESRKKSPSLAAQGWSIVLTSSPEATEMEMITSILKQIDSPHVFSLAGQVTLGELAALIEGARLFVGVDSVPMHMAAALQKDTVALFGPSKIKEWHPWMTRSEVIRASDYGPLLDPDAVITNTRERYLSNIPVAPVIAAIEKMLSRSEEDLHEKENDPLPH